MTAQVVRPVDARSGAVFERIRQGERRLFRKRVCPERDWVMRVTGDRDFRTAKAWTAGLLRDAADVVVHAVLDVAVVGGQLMVLMDDVGDRLVPPGDAGQSGAPVFAFHTSGFMTTARALYERLGYRRAPEFDRDLGAYFGVRSSVPWMALAYLKPVVLTMAA